MDRRNFLNTSLLTAISVSAFGKVTQNVNGNFTADCETTNDILGPFYRADAPLKQDLTFAGLKGNIINIKGVVYKDDCITPIKNSMVEIWHCNTDGEYDNESKDFNHRGRCFTTDKGEYSFKTILPGKYLNGDLYRPSHIHYRVTESNHKELVSQIYFKGDPHITKDPWASQSKAVSRVLQIFPEDIAGNLTVLFNIYLKSK